MAKQYSYAKDRGMKLSPHFAVGEFRSFNAKTGKLTSDLILVNDNLIVALEQIFTALNCGKIIVTSGYRDLAFEQALGGNANGQHVRGTAADIKCYDINGREINAKLVCVTCEDLGLQGIGFMCGGTHIDVRGCKSWFDETQGCKVVNSWREYFGMGNAPIPPKSITLKLGSWNIRQGTNTATRVVATIKGGQVYTSSKQADGWYYIDSLGGYVGPAAIKI